MLADGHSLAEIGRAAQKHPSTVGYWLKRHGLAATGAERFAARGPVSRDALASLAAEGLPLRVIAERLDRSISTVRYWLEQWDVPRERRGPRVPRDPEHAPRTSMMACVRHGETEFVLEGRGAYRCKRCRADRVSEWRRRAKRVLVAEAGGACEECGYDACVAAMEFHHLDPACKSFALSSNGVARSMDALRAEAAKCALLCANCHAEIENGHRTLGRGAA